MELFRRFRFKSKRSEPQDVPRPTHVEKWGIPRLEQLLGVGGVVVETDNAPILVAAYMHNLVRKAVSRQAAFTGQ